MSNQQAIASLRTLCHNCELFPKCVHEKPECFQAIELAISALESQEAKHSKESSPTHKALDTISRQAAIEALNRCTDVYHTNLPPLVDKEEVRRALASLPSAQPKQQWIPVSEKLPEPRVDVWVNSDIGQIQGYYEEHIGIWYASFGQGRDYLELIVTAWMPLPRPYRAERRTDDQSK